MRWTPTIVRIKVVLPLPEGPSNPVIRPAGMLKFSSWRMTLCALTMDRPLTCTAAADRDMVSFAGA